MLILFLFFPFLCGDFRISLRSIAFVINQSQRVVDEEIGGRSETERDWEEVSLPSAVSYIVCPSSLDHRLGKNDDCHASSPCSVGVCGVDA